MEERLCTADALLESSAMYETLGEVDQKLAKFVQNEYESINDFTSKYFKKTAVRSHTLPLLVTYLRERKLSVTIPSTK